jgi:hypothetical protein
LAEADYVSEFCFAEPSPLFNGDPVGPDDTATEAEQRYFEKFAEERAKPDGQPSIVCLGFRSLHEQCDPCS